MVFLDMVGVLRNTPARNPDSQARNDRPWAVQLPLLLEQMAGIWQVANHDL